VRALIATLSLWFAAPPLPLESSPYALDPGAAGAVMLSVRTLAIDDLAALGVAENALLATDVDLAWDANALPPGWVAPRAGLVARPVPLWRLGGGKPEGQVFHGSALSALLAKLSAELRARGIADARAALDPGAVRRLSTPGGDGLLLIRVVRGP
jgi:hypothetical protein